ncbi:MAG: DUF4926 domain-containing protein [SAR202 cluster bacterium Io17-Chloro-G9]|nr:MAG: DUF4926 domain-containing protein [SAR202 cluster bacterium Io17-Chloro-G9]
MLHELEIVVLTRDLDVGGLKKGGVGTIVHCYSGGKGFEVEFITGDGRTVAVATLDSVDIRRMKEGEILHAREITTV